MLEAGASAPAVLPNPLREGLAEERVPEPAAMVIFGASGDLAHRKLLPALYSLTRDRLLPARFAIVGFARRAISDEAFREEMRAACNEHARRRPIDPELWSAFARNIFYQQGEYEDPAVVHRRSSSGSPTSSARSACPATASSISRRRRRRSRR